MRVATLATTGRTALVLAMALGACGKMKPTDPHAADRARAQAKRQQAACGSSAAYDRLKGLIFDRAIGERGGDRANLDTLADYSFARMKDPVVAGWDPALDITHCRGRFILEVPPGAERGLAGAHQIQADVTYSAQAAADGSGYVYQIEGAEPIVNRLAAFTMPSGAYRPPPAIDEPQAGPEPSPSPEIARADVPRTPPVDTPARIAREEPVAPARQRYSAPEADDDAPDKPMPVSAEGGSGEATVRAFYRALGAGDGASASARIVPEKRSGRAYSPEAISRYYGRLPEPLRVTGLAPLAGGAYRVDYRYSAGRTHCLGTAVVRLTNRDGRELIRSIQALRGC